MVNKRFGFGEVDVTVFVLAVLAVLAASAASAALAASAVKARSAMVIVEPRRHKHLRYVIDNFHRNMPAEYELYVFHGTSSLAFARACASRVRGRRVHFVDLGVDNLTADEYNALLKDRRRFWDRVAAENVLIFQTDAVLCANSRKTIRDFEHLGYVGCAYDSVAGRGTHWGEHAFWGVGGLSFRKKSVALECLAAVGTAPGTPEDVFYSNCVDAGFGRRPADGRQLSEFCSQNNFLAESLGAHRLHDMMARDQLGAFLDYCPEAKPILDQYPRVHQKRRRRTLKARSASVVLHRPASTRSISSRPALPRPFTPPRPVWPTST